MRAVLKGPKPTKCATAGESAARIICLMALYTSPNGCGLQLPPWALCSCHYPHFYDMWVRISARGCGRQNRAWGGASAEPQEYGESTHQARGAGGSFLSCAISSSLRLVQWLSPAPRACAINPDRTWGSATLRPRLYAGARSAGFRKELIKYALSE